MRMIYICNELSNWKVITSQVSKLQNICNFSIFSFHVGMWKKKIKTKVAFGQKHFVPGRSSKNREYSYRQSDTCPWIKCKPVTFLNNGNGNNSSQHLQNTSYTLCVHHLPYSSEQRSAAFTVAIWLTVSGGAGDSNPNALLTPYSLDWCLLLSHWAHCPATGRWESGVCAKSALSSNPKDHTPEKASKPKPDKDELRKVYSSLSNISEQIHSDNKQLRVQQKSVSKVQKLQQNVCIC